MRILACEGNLLATVLEAKQHSSCEFSMASRLFFSFFTKEEDILGSQFVLAVSSGISLS